MMFQKNKCYENVNPATSTYIKVVDVLKNNSTESDLVVQFITKIADMPIAVDEISIKASDYDLWRELKSTESMEAE